METFWPVNSVGEAFAHPQIQARGMVVDMEHAEAGPIPHGRIADQVRRQIVGVGVAPPLLGQHTTEILRAAGYEDQAITALLGSGAAYQHPIGT